MATMNVLKILKNGLLNLDTLTALEFTALQKKLQKKVTALEEEKLGIIEKLEEEFEF